MAAGDTAIHALVKKWEQKIRCILCDKTYNSPKLLPCCHSFCCTCLDKLAISTTQERRCPLCKFEIKLPQIGSFAEELPDSCVERRLVENFTEFRQKHIESSDGPRCETCIEKSEDLVGYCIDYDRLLCSFCLNSHKRLCNLKGHRVKRLEDFCLEDYASARKFQIFSCDKDGHAGEKLEFFCEQCAICICHKCKSTNGGEHAYHDGIISLSEAAGEAKKSIAKGMEIAESRVEELKDHCGKINKSKEEFENQKGACKKALESLYNRVKEKTLHIDRRRDLLLEQVENETKLPNTLLEEQLKRIHEHAKELSKTIASAKDLIQNESDVDILHETATRLHWLKRQTNTEIDTRPAARAKITFEPYSLPVDQHDSEEQISDHGIGEISMQFGRPSQSIAEGNGLVSAFDGLQAQFVVTRKNEDGGDVRYHHDDEPPTVTFTPTSRPEALPWKVKINNKENGQYEVMYTARDPGSYNITIKIADEHIYKSPFTLLVRPREFKCEKVIGSYGGEEGRFRAPWGVAVNSKDEIAVSDQHNHRVQIFNSDGKFKKTIGGYGAEEGHFHCPFGLTYDNNDNLLVVDANNSRIQTFNGEGEFVMQFGKKGDGDGELNLPWSVSIDAEQGNIIVSDKGNNRIQIFSRDGAYLAKFGSMGEEVLSWPIACVLHSNHYFVSDTNNHCVKIFTKGGVYVSKFGTEGQKEGQLLKNQGLLVDKADNVVVCDSWNDRIQLFKLDVDSRSVYSFRHFGTTGKQEGCLNDPSYVAMLSDGRFVVGDYRNHRVQIIA